MARILIVDDNKDVRETVAATLQLENHLTFEAPDGAAALRLIHSQEFDLVVTDLFMPQVGGEEMIQRLREEFPRVKIIAISGGMPALGGKQSNANRPLNRLDADARLAKPFHRRDLLAAVQSLLPAA